MLFFASSLLCFIGAHGLPSARIDNEEPLTLSPNLIPKSLESTSAPLTISPNLILNRAINTCDCAKATSSDRIVGGKEVSPKHKLPYQVLFQAGSFMCGGTIINKRYIITAAHCLFDGKTQMQPSTHQLMVMIGEHNICDGANEGGKVIKVEKVHVRSDYGNNANDFAILKLAEDIKFTANIKPACLPEKTDKDYSGQTGIISGWGGTIGYNPGEKQPKQPEQCGLKESAVKIINPSDKSCSQTTDGDSKTRICGFAKGTDTCQGDSGGPLTVVEGGKYVLVGVVSYGAGCASRFPGVYARVQNYMEWIKELTADGECSSTPSATTAAPATTAATKPAATTTTSGTTTTKGSTEDYSYYYYG